MSGSETRLISRSEVAKLLQVQECMDAVEETFKLYAEGKVAPPKVMGVHVAGGGFHTKAGTMNLNRHYFVAKTNANFPDNKAKNGLPTIQGVIVVCDAGNGRLLALMDSIEITIIRTGAATGIAAKYLSRKNASVAIIVGCGNQGSISIKSISQVRKLEKVYACDIDRSRQSEFASVLSNELQIPVIPVDDFRRAAKESDIVVTCTTSKEPFLNVNDIRPGTFIAAVGADSEDKQELSVQLLASGKIITDLSEQCASIGELHHALKNGVVTMTDVRAELGEVIAGYKQGRKSDDEIIIFDSTGTALQDVAAASIVFEKALIDGTGSNKDFTK